MNSLNPIPLLSLNNLSYSYHTLNGETKALDNITFQIFICEIIIYNMAYLSTTYCSYYKFIVWYSWGEMYEQW